MVPDLLSGLWEFLLWVGFGTLMSPGAGAFAGWLTTGFTHRVSGGAGVAGGLLFGLIVWCSFIAVWWFWGRSLDDMKTFVIVSAILSMALSAIIGIGWVLFLVLVRLDTGPLPTTTPPPNGSTVKRRRFVNRIRAPQNGAWGTKTSDSVCRRKSGESACRTCHRF